MMKFEYITEKIIKAAYTVYNTLGFGFLESVYEKSLILEMKANGLNAESQKAIEVFYRSEKVGDFFTDILVEGKIIVELKSVRKLIEIHEVQLVNYLKATGLEVGLLINFGEKNVQVKRKVKEFDPK